MTEIVLQFRYTTSPQRPTCARFIPHSEPAAWLDELTGWGVPLGGLRLYPLPRSRTDNTCLGVLVADAASVGGDAGSIRHVGDAASDSETTHRRPVADATKNVGGDAGSIRHVGDAASVSETTRRRPVADATKNVGTNAGSIRHVVLPVRSGAMQPYGRLAGRLFLPVEAALSVELSAAEWRELLGATRTEYVWHPQAGLVAFDPEEVLTVADLLTPHAPVEAPSRSPVDWGCARLGVTFPNRIRSLRAELPASVSVMLTDGRDDIGTLAKNLNELPLPLPLRLKAMGMAVGRLAWLPFAMLGGFLSRLFPPMPRVPRRASSGFSDTVFGVIAVALVAILIALAVHDPLGRLWFLAFFVFAMFLVFLALVLIAWIWEKICQSGLLSRASTPVPPRIGPTGGMFATLRAGLQRQVAGFMRWTAGLLDARRREVDRLMRLLDEDPDEGLKYALPMGGDAARGIAPPSDSLISRAVDFQLNRAGSGGPADLWDLPVDTQYQLVKRYRELAAREVQLGRYRRAAYIYAELLGDLNLAATTLVNGRFYREAAVLYRDKLNRPLDAAHCLEQGGLLLEAIPLYRRQGQIEKVGDLYRRLEDHDQADSAYREAVDFTLAKHDHLDAARLFQEKLDSPDEALAALDAGWPESPQARNCLKNSFTLLASLGRHEDAIQRIRGLRQSPLSPTRAADAIDVLASTAVNAPHAGSRLVAADTVRIMASRVLTEGHVSRQQITSAVGRLAPEDLLLARDCTRAAEKSSVDKPANTKSRNIKPTARLVKTFLLPVGVTWTSVCGTDNAFYMAGRKGTNVVLSRGMWDDPAAVVSTLTWNTTLREGAQVMVCRPGNRDAVVSIGATAPFNFVPQAFARTDAAPHTEVAGSLGKTPSESSAIAAAPHGMICTFQMREMVLTGFDRAGQPIIPQTIGINLNDQTVDPDETYPMVAHDGVVYLGVGPQLIEHRTNSDAEILELRDPIRALAVTHPHATEPLVAVLFDLYGLIMGLPNNRRTEHFGDGLRDPRAVFLRNGDLVVHGQGSWVVYVTHAPQLQQLHEMACDVEQETLALLRARAASQVGLCTTDGQVRVYEFPGPLPDEG